jgi:fructokinase
VPARIDGGRLEDLGVHAAHPCVRLSGMSAALVVGESLIDVVHRLDGTTVEHAGGSAANVAVALARLGRPVQFLTAYGDDAHGAFLARHLNQSAVGLVGDPHTLERTATATATLAADGSASYTFDIAWSLGEVPELEPQVVHACSIGAVLEPGATEVRRLLERLRPHASISYDVNARPAVTGMGPDVVRAVEDVMGLADLVKASDEDLDALYPGEPLGQAVDRILGLGPTAVVVTRGRLGAIWFGEGRRVEVAAHYTEVADTIGAGDTLGAAIIDALWDLDVLGGRLGGLDEGDVESVLRHAVRAAAVTVSRPGADPPYRHELF